MVLQGREDESVTQVPRLAHPMNQGDPALPLKSRARGQHAGIRRQTSARSDQNHICLLGHRFQGEGSGNLGAQPDAVANPYVEQARRQDARRHQIDVELQELAILRG